MDATHRLFAGLLTVVAVALAAGCSSDSDEPAAGRDAWEPAALDQAHAIQDDLARTIGGCTERTDNVFADAKANAKANGFSELPLAQALCVVADEETVEISVFAGSDERAAYVDDRTTTLCRIALDPKGDREPVKGFPGLRFAVGPDWAVQVDLQDTGRSVAEALDGTYEGRPCEGDTSDWEAGALDTALERLGRLEPADCPDPYVTNRDVARMQEYNERTPPAAAVSCAPVGTKVHLMEFGAAVDDPAEYLRTTAEFWCLSGSVTTTVLGDTWGAVVTDSDDRLATRVVDALGGRAQPLDCPPASTGSAATSTPSSPTTTG